MLQHSAGGAARRVADVDFAVGTDGEALGKGNGTRGCDFVPCGGDRRRWTFKIGLWISAAPHHRAENNQANPEQACSA